VGLLPIVRTLIGYLPEEASVDGGRYPPITMGEVTMQFESNALIEDDGFAIFQKV